MLWLTVNSANLLINVMSAVVSLVLRNSCSSPQSDSQTSKERSRYPIRRCARGVIEAFLALVRFVLAFFAYSLTSLI